MENQELKTVVKKDKWYVSLSAFLVCLIIVTAIYFGARRIYQNSTPDGQVYFSQVEDNNITLTINQEYPFQVEITGNLKGFELHIKVSDESVEYTYLDEVLTLTPTKKGNYEIELYYLHGWTNKKTISNTYFLIVE